MKNAGATKGGGQKGYLPTKNMIPAKLSKENRRDWREDILSYMDTQTPGIKELLKQAAMTKDEIGDSWLQTMTETYGMKSTTVARGTRPSPSVMATPQRS